MDEKLCRSLLMHYYRKAFAGDPYQFRCLVNALHTLDIFSLLSPSLSEFASFLYEDLDKEGCLDEKSLSDDWEVIPFAPSIE